MAQTQVKKVSREKAPAPEARATETKPSRDLVDDIDAMLEEIDAVLEEVAGGNTSEYAETFVRGYVQKGGQ